MRNRVAAAIAALAVFAAILIPAGPAEAHARKCNVWIPGGRQPVACRSHVRPSAPAWLRNMSRDWWW